MALRCLVMLIVLTICMISDSVFAVEHKLEQVIITTESLKFKEEKEKEPAMIKIFTSQDIEKMNLKDAWDILNHISGITLMKYTGGGIGQARVAIRGQMLHAGANHFAVFLDDVPLNEPGGAGPIFAGQADLNSITPEMIDYVEVIKGPFDIDAGDFNTAAVIKFYTKKYSKKSSITAEGGSYGYARGQASLSNEFLSNFKHFTSIEFKRQDGFADNTDIDYFVNANSNITYGDLNANHTTLSLTAFSYDAKVPTGFGKVYWDGGAWKLAPNDSDGRTKDEARFALNNVWIISPQWKWTNLAWARYWQGTWWEDTHLVWTGSQQREQYQKRNDFGYRSHLDYDTEIWGRYFQAIVGFDFRKDFYDTDQWRTDGHRNRLNKTLGFDGDYIQVAGYFKMQMDIVPSVRAYVGLRYDHIRYDVDSEFSDNFKVESNPVSPKGGVTWQATENISFFVQASKGTRTPDPQYANEDGVTTSINYEIGSKGHFLGGRLNYMISGYYTQLKDVNVRETASQKYLFTGDQNVPGVEFELSANVIKPLTLWATFGYNWAEWENPKDVEGKGIVGVDPWDFSLGADYDSGFGIRGRIEYITNGRQWMNSNYDRREPKTYQLVNLLLMYNPMKNLEIFLKANNLLDERYCTWPAYDFYRPEPGINFTGGLKLSF